MGPGGRAGTGRRAQRAAGHPAPGDAKEEGMADGVERGQLIYLSAPQQIEYLEYELPEPEPGGILAKVVRANVCGSELHIWKGLHPTVKRCVMGHEMVGQVYKLGAGVETDYAGQPLEPGTRIVAAYFLT